MKKNTQVKNTSEDYVTDTNIIYSCMYDIHVHARCQKKRKKTIGYIKIKVNYTTGYTSEEYKLRNRYKYHTLH